MKPISIILLIILSSCSKNSFNEYSYEDDGIRKVSVMIHMIKNADKKVYAIELFFDKWVKGDVLGNVTWQLEDVNSGVIQYYNVNFNIYCDGLSCESDLEEPVYWWYLAPDNIELISIKCNGYIFKQ